MFRKSVRLSDIAEQAGVSTVTVSNALAGRKGVSEELRSRIFETARECGYDLSRYERKKKQQETIGILVSSRYIRVGLSFYWEMYQKVAFCLSQNGMYSTLEILSEEEEDADKPAMPRCLESGKADQLIVIGKLHKSYLDRLMQKAQDRTVLLDFRDPDYNCSAVLSNNCTGMYRATQYLIDHGHHAIGFLGTPQTSRNIRDRFYGYMKCMDDNALPIHSEWIIADRNPENENETGVNLPEALPSAFACSSDFGAAILMEGLLERGIRVPEDLSLASYDDYMGGDTLRQKLTTFHVDMERMAENAVQMLQQGNTQQQRARAIYVDSVLVERESVRQTEEIVQPQANCGIER